MGAEDPEVTFLGRKLYWRHFALEERPARDSQSEGQWIIEKVEHKEINGKQYSLIAEAGSLEAPNERLIRRPAWWLPSVDDSNPQTLWMFGFLIRAWEVYEKCIH